MPESCHEKRARNGLKDLVYVGEHAPDNTQCKYKEIDRKYYKYKKSIDVSSKSILATDLDWPFPKTYWKSISSAVRGFNIFSQTYLR